MTSRGSRRATPHGQTSTLQHHGIPEDVARATRAKTIRNEERHARRQPEERARIGPLVT
jgi:hypothetical protein